MGTKEAIAYESYYVEGKHKEEEKNLFETKETVINDLLKRVSNLEFEVEKLEKNVQYKYINGQAYFRQDYVLGREKEIDKLNAELNLYKDNQEHLNNLLEHKNNIIKEVREYCKPVIVDGEEKELCVNGKDILEILDKVGSDKE